jgi:hypothetical protein
VSPGASPAATSPLAKEREMGERDGRERREREMGEREIWEMGERERE